MSDEKPASLPSLMSHERATMNKGGGSNQSLEGTNCLKYIPSSVNVGGSVKPRDEALAIPQFGDTEKYSNPADLCCVSLFCAAHRRLALVELDNKGLFMPCEQFNLSNVTIDWVLNNTIRKIVDAQNVKFRNLLITKIDRMQLPKKATFVTRYIYRVEVTNGTSVTGNMCICQLTHKVPIQWLTHGEICQKMSSLAGPEPKFVFDRTTFLEDLQPGGFKRTSVELFREHSTEDAICNFKPEMANKKCQLVNCANLQWWEVKSLHNEFVLHCFPSSSMTQGSLARLLHTKLLVPQLTEEKLSKYFRSFDSNKRHYLNFGELLQGLAVFKIGQLACNHQTCNQIRHEHIFRYYSSAAKHDRLSTDDLCNLMLDLADKQANSETLTAARHRVEAIADKHKVTLDSAGTTMEQYLALVKDEFSQPAKALLLNLNLDSIALAKNAHKPGKTTATQSLANHNWTDADKKCAACTRTKFYLSSHFISLTEIGEVSEISKLEADASHIPPKEFKQDISESDIYVLANDLLDRIKRFGILKFNQDDMPTVLSRQVENLFFPTRSVAVNYLKMVANKAEEIFASEPRVLNIASPCYVFGDIHGNLKDLLNFSQNLWKTSPFVNQGKYLFLGDYVDRGSYGVECVIYLFCMKILAPNNFFILRGNHEVREIQEQFSFYRECNTRYNDELWDIINMAFDRLPIAATIDNKVYCAHGGIPASVTTIDQIRSIPSPLDNPIIQSVETWEILWNDPISKLDFARLSAFEQNFTLESNGFARNTKRGTAMMYTETAVVQFLKRNQLEQILRAHEVYDEGYRFHLLGQVLSVFSCSKYVDLNNRASVLFLDGHQIRIIQICTE